MDITLSLVSHTNVGKTTLVRTLLGTEVGEVRDAPHVTEFADGHDLIASPEGDLLRLWDTPGFGDSARLLQRLRGSAQPLGWLLSQVWDRWRDRPFWLTQQALRHVQADSDVLLYLVNAAESPAAAGYVAPEMDLLAWVGKPVLVLLNQLGAPREPAEEAADVQIWRQHLQRWPGVLGVLPLDAFARCWVHETALLQAVQQLLAGDQAAAMARLSAAWQRRSQATFDAAMLELAQSLARTACARQLLDGDDGALRGGLRQIGSTLGQLARRVGRMGRVVGVTTASPSGPAVSGEHAGKPANATNATNATNAANAANSSNAANATDPTDTSDAANALTAPQRALAAALDAEVAASTGRLLVLHGLAGQAQGEILQRVAGQFAAVQRVPEGQAALWGGAVTGALAGLKADIVSGGLTLGGGMLAGALIGALGAAGRARGINVVRGADHSWLRWSDEALGPLTESAMLRYLAVAHFGRGRGEWVQGEAPAHWRNTVAEALAPAQPALAALWAARDRRSQMPIEVTADAAELSAQLQPLLAASALRALERLYPAAYHRAV